MNSYKATCPKCHGDNFYITVKNGMGYCFSPSCHYVEFNGTAKRAERVRSDNIPEIRTIYKDAARYYHGNINNKILQYLYGRGFTDNTINELQIGYCPKGTLPLYRDPIAKEAGIATAKHEAFLEDRITFPYFKTKDVITDIRGRAINPNAELKYKSPFGDTLYRGAIYPYNYHLAQDAKTLILAESEIKADAAYQLGYAAIGIPGIGSWRSGFTQSDNQEVIIVFDNESNHNTQRDVIYALRKIAGELIKPKIAVLPLDTHDKKAEIDTFIMRHGGELFRSIIDNALDFKVWNSLQNF